MHLCTQVLAARTAAVGLASASLAARGKDTLDQLEDTRTELARVQVAANFENKSSSLFKTNPRSCGPASRQSGGGSARPAGSRRRRRQLGWRRRRSVNQKF